MALLSSLRAAVTRNYCYSVTKSTFPHPTRECALMSCVRCSRRNRFGTQRVISFMRQLVEHGGFWRPSPVGSQGGGERVWVTLRRIHFVAACNPPTNAGACVRACVLVFFTYRTNRVPGRVPLPPRFLRHCPVLFVDCPASDSLSTIYETFNTGLCR